MRDELLRAFAAESDNNDNAAEDDAVADPQVAITARRLAQLPAAPQMSFVLPQWSREAIARELEPLRADVRLGGRIDPVALEATRPVTVIRVAGQRVVATPGALQLRPLVEEPPAQLLNDELATFLAELEQMQLPQ